MNFTGLLRSTSLVFVLVGLSLSLCACERHRGKSVDPQDALSLPANNHNVLTFHNDNGRTGQYLTEMVLQPSVVSSTTFGKIAYLPVQGLVDAQPLFVANLKVGGNSHNVVFVVTELDVVYAFDADNHALLWKKSVVGPAETP